MRSAPPPQRSPYLRRGQQQCSDSTGRGVWIHCDSDNCTQGSVVLGGRETESGMRRRSPTTGNRRHKEGRLGWKGEVEERMGKKVR